MSSANEYQMTGPLSIAEMKAQMRDADGLIRGRVRVSFSECICLGLESFLDLLSEALTGSLLLMDIRYRIVATDADGDTLVIEVWGNPSEIIADEEDSANG